MRILVTGASGFIGQNLCAALKVNGMNFLATDLFPHDPSVIKMDIRDKDALKLLKEFRAEVVVHLAAQVNVTQSLCDPIGDLESNILGTVNLFQAGSESGMQNFVYISSGGAIYDENSIRPTKETDDIDLKSPYGVSKLAAEFYVKVLSRVHGLSWSSLALSNCYGAVSQCKKGVIFNFWSKIKSMEPATINGPLTTRDFIHVSDVIDAILKAIESPTFCRVNISTAIETSLIDLYASVSKCMNSQIDPLIGELDPSEVARSCLDNSLAKTLLGWKPKVSIDEGVRGALI